MKKTLLLFFAISVWCCSPFGGQGAFAQPGEWTWIHGDGVANQPGNFGTQGVPSATNKPPAVYEGCEWTDHNGNFWMYGGQHTAGNFYGDLWKYEPATNMWTWMKGPGFMNQAGVYGVQGVSSPLNNPGGRGWAPSSWVDNNNNLWMLAGCDMNTGDMNDLWMYNTSINEWTWMRGSPFSGSAGSPGTMGVPSTTNDPSARHESTCSWIGSNGDLWFFGGFGFGQTDDMWRYNIATNMWTWMKGDPVGSVPPVYGTMGVPDPLNTPGARNSYSRWADDNENLWLFGGVFYSAGSYNDVWKYSTSTSEWTWMRGPNVADDPGTYGVACAEDILNNPPARLENRSCWADSCGNFWVFGGVTAVGTYPSKNDLWKYSPATNSWAWVNGSQSINQPGSYGTIGVSSPANSPPARMGSFAWQDLNGNLWMGMGQMNAVNAYYNDLWRFVPDPSCAGCSMIPIALFSAPNHICPGTCTDFVNLSQNTTYYEWSFPGGTPSASTDPSPTNICYNTPGSYSVTLIAGNTVTSDTLVLNNYITVYSYPAPQGIMQSGDTLFANAGAVTYQWYYDGNLIPGATNYFYVAPQSGNYNVVATDANGCPVEAAIFDVIAEVQSLGNSHWSLEIYPNPAGDKLEVRSSFPGGRAPFRDKTVLISIYNMLGESTLAVQLSTPNSSLHTELDVRALSSGMYYLEVTDGKRVIRAKFVKQ